VGKIKWSIAEKIDFLFDVFSIVIGFFAATVLLNFVVYGVRV
tara:strand:- start:5010 stop:5135 length:126 start_codon:yes stop_codon:yes gene_type:complete